MLLMVCFQDFAFTFTFTYELNTYATHLFFIPNILRQFFTSSMSIHPKEHFKNFKS